MQQLRDSILPENLGLMRETLMRQDREFHQQALRREIAQEDGPITEMVEPSYTGNRKERRAAAALDRREKKAKIADVVIEPGDPHWHKVEAV